MCLPLSATFYFCLVSWSTRDFPWANLLLSHGGRAFGGWSAACVVHLTAPHPKRSKIIGSVVAISKRSDFRVFYFRRVYGARWLPASAGHPQVGQKGAGLHAFQITSGQAVVMADGAPVVPPVNGKSAKGSFLSSTELLGTVMQLRVAEHSN